MEHDNFIITINREFGTGGREIAQKLGNILGVKVYDKNLLDSLAQQFNMTENDIENARSKTSWWDEFANFYKQFGSSNHVDFKERVTSREIYHAEEKILKELAEKESCIVVGRAGFHIFKDYPNAVKVLLVADFDARVKRLCETMDLSISEASKMIKEIDDKREKYTKKYTGLSRYDAHNYDFVINVTNIPTYHVAVFLAQNMRWKFNNNGL